jgi:hypothetical protein
MLANIATNQKTGGEKKEGNKPNGTCYLLQLTNVGYYPIASIQLHTRWLMSSVRSTMQTL